MANIDVHSQLNGDLSNGIPPRNGFVGLSTSSFSSSSDINGVKSSRKGAITSINDNGKITTYRLE